MLKFKMYDRIEKYDLNYCEDVIFDLINLTVKISHMIISKKPGVLQEIKKLYDGILQYENESDMNMNPLNMMIIMNYLKTVILVKL